MSGQRPVTLVLALAGLLTALGGCTDGSGSVTECARFAPEPGASGAVGVLQTAPTGTTEWIRLSATDRYDEIHDVWGDESGVAVVGWTDLLPATWQQPGRIDAVVRTYDHDGNARWDRQFGAPESHVVAQAIVSDRSGLYVVGRVRGEVPGFAHFGDWDAFVRKYDRAGNEFWSRGFGTESQDVAGAVAAHASGVYVAGDLHGSRSLLPNFDASQPDAYVRKYDTDGNELWTVEFGSPETESIEGAAVDESGVYVVGYTEGTLPGQVSSGGRDAFIRKYHHAGRELWIRQFGTAASESAAAVSVSASGIYVLVVEGTDLFDAPASVWRFDSDGLETWTRVFGALSRDPGDLFADASGVYVTGSARQAPPGRTNAGLTDVLVRRFDSDGTEVWHRYFGTSAYDSGTAIWAEAGAVYVAGSRQPDGFVLRCAA